MHHHILHMQHDAGPDHLVEPRFPNHNAILAGAKIGDNVEAMAVGLGDGADIGQDVGDFDPGAGHDRALRVGHSSRQGRRFKLSVAGKRNTQNQQKETTKPKSLS